MTHEEELLFPLRQKLYEHKDSNGHVLTLCVLHKLDPEQYEEAQAGVVVGGLSLCHEHGDMAIGFILGGYSIEAVMQMQVDGTLESFYKAVQDKDEETIQRIQSELESPFAFDFNEIAVKDYIDGSSPAASPTESPSEAGGGTEARG